MTTAQKDTIYIDVDDEITSIIDKVKDSQAKIVALVLPKRATVLQSIVNMKLLKRTADDEGKRAVLVTSETGLLPIAGAVGVYVAKSLQSQPELPENPAMAKEEDSVDLAEENVDKNKSVGELASKKEDTVELEDDEPETPAKAPKAKGAKSPKIPNFEKFRLKLFLGAGALLVIFGIWYAAAFLVGKANVTIKTNTEPVNASLTFTADTTATAVDAAQMIVPAEQVESQKEDTQKVDTTGQKDIGEKATGTITVKNCASSTPPTLSSGSKFTSSSGKIFVTTAAFTPEPATVNGGIVCGTSTVSVTAADNGEGYNIAATTYTNATLSDGYTLTGGDMTGGSSEVVKVVTQQDVDNAKAKLNTSSDTISEELATQLNNSGMFAIVDSFKANDAKTTISPKVGEQGDSVTVTYSATFTMVGVNREDMKAVLEESIKNQIDTEKQDIQDDGLDQATFNVKKRASDGSLTSALSSSLGVGPHIDQDKIKADIAGKKKGDTTNIIKALPSVNDVTVDYSPFWVNKTPKDPNKIFIELVKAE